MNDEEKETGVGWPEPAGPTRPMGPAAEPDPRPDAPPADGVGPLVLDPGEPGDPAAPGQRGPGPVRPEPDRPDPDPDPERSDGDDPEPDRSDRETPDPDGPDPDGADPDGPGPDAADPDGPGPDDDADGPERPPADDGDGVAAAAPPRSRRPSAASVMIAALLALLGFTLAVQLKTNSADPTLASARQDDLVRILSDLEAQQQRVRQDIAGLEDSQRQLASGAQGREAALAEATRRADELGILAGTLPARGPGLTVRFSAASKPIAASTLLDAVQELRGAGAEAMQISGGDGATTRIIASTYFLDADGGVDVGARRLTGPYTITVIGEPQTMRTALNIAGGVVASVEGDGGNVIVDEHEVVDIKALSNPTDLKYARPVS